MKQEPSGTGVDTGAATDGGTDGVDPDQERCPCEWPEVFPLIEPLTWDWIQKYKDDALPGAPASADDHQWFKPTTTEIRLADGSTINGVYWVKYNWEDRPSGSRWVEEPSDEGDVYFEIHFRECPYWFMTFGREGFGQLPDPGGTPPGPNHCLLLEEDWHMIKDGTWEDFKIRTSPDDLFRLKFERGDKEHTPEDLGFFHHVAPVP